MEDNTYFDVIITGGSYSGLAAAMALGRALKQVLVIDSGLPCNRQTPHSHNFLTQDGQAPQQIAAIARAQVQQYSTISFLSDLATEGTKTENGFEITTAAGKRFSAGRLLFATGIKDLLPPIEGLAECWGTTVIHCPYCHGYEVRNEQTGILANGEQAFEMAILISNWTKDLTIYTNGGAIPEEEQKTLLAERNIMVVEKEIERLAHTNGQLQHIVFKDGTTALIKAMYAKVAFEQHCKIPESLGCALTDAGYLKTDMMYETTVAGVYACGDNVSQVRTVANAVATGTTSGIMISRKMIFENF